MEWKTRTGGSAVIGIMSFRMTHLSGGMVKSANGRRWWNTGKSFEMADAPNR